MSENMGEQVLQEVNNILQIINIPGRGVVCTIGTLVGHAYPELDKEARLYFTGQLVLGLINGQCIHDVVERLLGDGVKKEEVAELEKMFKQGEKHD